MRLKHFRRNEHLDVWCQSIQLHEKSLKETLKDKVEDFLRTHMCHLRIETERAC